jgi:hypothetical protein
MNKIQNGLELGRQSWNALRANPHLLIFPLISMVASILVTIAFFIPLAGTALADFASGRSAEEGPSVVTVIVLFLYYFANYFVIIFSNTALIGAVMKILRGETATVQDGLNIALARIDKIFVYALISATVGMIARAIRDSGRRSNNVVAAIVSAIIASLVQGAWNLVVFFAIPILVVENVGVIQSMRRSLDVFKRTWGESFVGSTAIGGISCLIYIAVIAVGALLIIGAISTQSTALIVLAIGVVVIALVGLSLVSGAINAVFQASLYQYATTGDAGKFIDTELARQAFGSAPNPNPA